MSGSLSRRRSAARAVAAPALAQNEQFIPAPGLSDRRLCAERRAVRQRHRRLLQAGQRARRRHQRRQDRVRGMRVRLRHRSRRRVLRAPQGQGSDRRRLRHPAVDRRHLRAHRKDHDRQDPDHLHGLRPLGIARRLGVPVELPAARHLLDRRRHHPSAHRQEGRRLRQAQGQEDRAGLSRLALRQGADRAAAEARADARLRDDAPAGHPSRRRAEGDLAADPPEPSRLRAAVGLGRDELDRDQGGGRGRLSARQDVRRVVVGRRARRAAGRGRRQGLQRGHAAAHAPASSSCTRTSRSTSTTRARARRSGRRPARSSTSAG